jgi:hypothetical protein
MTMASLDRANQIVDYLNAKGIRATTDPSAINLPAVLVNLPSDRRNDLNCGVSVTWQLDLIVPAPNGWDRTAWRQMDELILAVEAALPIQSSRSQPFQRPGLAWLTSFPSYVCSFTEAMP